MTSAEDLQIASDIAMRVTAKVTDIKFNHPLLGDINIWIAIEDGITAVYAGTLENDLLQLGWYDDETVALWWSGRQMPSFMIDKILD